MPKFALVDTTKLNIFTEIVCEDPSLIQVTNGRVENCSQSANFKSVCVVACNEGFLLAEEGASHVTCQENKMWLPNKIESSCGQFVQFLENKNYENFHKMFNSKLKFVLSLPLRFLYKKKLLKKHKNNKNNKIRNKNCF